MSETDTSREAVERDAEYWESWAADIRANNGSVADAANMDAICARYRALLARAENAEADISSMRDAVAEIEGFSEDWPTHGNIPLAIVAGYSLHKSGREEAEAERDTAWNDAIEAAAKYHDEIFKHDSQGVEYSSLVGVPISNLSDLEASSRKAEMDAAAIRALKKGADQ